MHALYHNINNFGVCYESLDRWGWEQLVIAIPADLLLDILEILHIAAVIQSLFIKPCESFAKAHKYQVLINMPHPNPCIYSLNLDIPP